MALIILMATISPTTPAIMYQKLRANAMFVFLKAPTPVVLETLPWPE